MNDKHARFNARLIDCVDTAWKEIKLPNEDITVPPGELPDPDADNGDSLMTFKEQEQKWMDLGLGILNEQHQNCPT